MSYTKNTWAYHDFITANKMNNIELGLDSLDTKSALLQEATNNLESEISTFEDTGEGLLLRGNFQRGIYNPVNNTTNSSYQYRISSRKQIMFPYEAKLTVKSGFRILPYRYENNAWAQKSWNNTVYTVSANTPFYLQIARSTDNSSEVADVAEFLKAVVVSGNPMKKTIDLISEEIPQLQVVSDQLLSMTANDYLPVEIEQGRWAFSAGALQDDDSNTTRIRATSIYKIVTGQKVIFKSDTIQCYITLISALTNGEILQNSGWVAVGAEYVFTANYDGYIYINYRFSGDGTITTSDYDGYTYVGVRGLPYNIPGKAVHVYQFGGAGNDWCFVRTPANYNPRRNRPYPFVICNHGNGWTMDGTLQKANWTKRTMYVPLDDTDYIASPSQYNGTADKSLWYSNPTIEALLTAGYIVCGCQNYGDGLYGNNSCRNACVDFFYHMVDNYNVENRCYMIGASNGAMTTLNAAYLLQGAVKAIILQYPLTCLVNQYETNSSHQAGIRTAYGISNASITEEELATAVATHDPLTTDVVDGRKIGTFPPTQIYYSESDSVVNYQANTIALFTMLEASNKVVELYKKSGEHGNSSMFDPTAFVEWFDSN